jgi:hypothetical protein
MTYESYLAPRYYTLWILKKWLDRHPGWFFFKQRLDRIASEGIDKETKAFCQCLPAGTPQVSLLRVGARILTYLSKRRNHHQSWNILFP